MFLGLSEVVLLGKPIDPCAPRRASHTAIKTLYLRWSHLGMGQTTSRVARLNG